MTILRQVAAAVTLLCAFVIAGDEPAPALTWYIVGALSAVFVYLLAGRPTR